MQIKRFYIKNFHTMALVSFIFCLKKCDIFEKDFCLIN